MLGTFPDFNGRFHDGGRIAVRNLLQPRGNTVSALAVAALGLFVRTVSLHMHHSERLLSFPRS